MSGMSYLSSSMNRWMRMVNKYQFLFCYCSEIEIVMLPTIIYVMKQGAYTSMVLAILAMVHGNVNRSDQVLNPVLKSCELVKA